MIKIMAINAHVTILIAIYLNEYLIVVTLVDLNEYAIIATAMFLNKYKIFVTSLILNDCDDRTWNDFKFVTLVVVDNYMCMWSS